MAVTHPDVVIQHDLATGISTELARSNDPFFSANHELRQLWFTSRDGTRVPMFLTHRQGLELDGTNPTLLYGYGGFEIALKPWYSGGFGRAWYARGGVLVVANIRGGGEFGPAWHQAAAKQNKQRSYDDFIAVAEDLVATGVTSPEHLGAMGGDPRLTPNFSALIEDDSVSQDMYNERFQGEGMPDWAVLGDAAAAVSAAAKPEAPHGSRRQSQLTPHGGQRSRHASACALSTSIWAVAPTPPHPPLPTPP